MNTPVHPQIQRTLAAIVVTDAVGFSKHMSQDEDRALSIINRDLQLIGELCEFFEGKILKTVGDGMLMYFVSAVQAAACAIEVQKTFGGFIQSGQAGNHFVHRVGVHLGDIFFNQEDMMGTGVNVAARLESEAYPGAICMSQVVYNVVKSRLDLDADYIGELALKNIEGGIPAYHVWPRGMRPEGTNGGETTEAIAPLAVTPLRAALKTLASHKNHRRIKKLLYGVYYGMWENNAAVLEAVPLKTLIEVLTERNETLEDCRQSLYRIVNTLNRKTAYATVADTILDSLYAFYSEESSGAIDTEADAFPTEAGGGLINPMIALYKDVADRIDLRAERVRMKKLVYCLCYEKWENDSEAIAQIRTIMLVEALYQQITTIQGLQNRLRAVLLRLNRKATYAPIANALFEECQALYPESNSQVAMPGAADLEDPSEDCTEIKVAQKSATRWAENQSPTPD
ncbi:MAG: hypothetical protein DCF25_13320 [Leptolyngbya foveolarum]|uniref:Guanylate cyclase domain-containing protein n=1 Tax=Leptolyngbya foveolarum TaxID=47253 RepID=A0A2W4U995_9CYAN|nr:MAG: hypothetical protein DCF25_13320 [Leptolyngbya foveolarum]